MAGTGVDLDNVLGSASQLGNHAVLYSCTDNSILLRKPLKFTNIDKDVFVHVVAQRDLSFFNENFDISDTELGITDVLYSRVEKKSVRRNQSSDQVDIHLGRYERLLSDRDDSRVWKAVDWKGELTSENSDKSCPSSDQ